MHSRKIRASLGMVIVATFSFSFQAGCAKKPNLQEMSEVDEARQSAIAAEKQAHQLRIEKHRLEQQKQNSSE